MSEKTGKPPIKEPSVDPATEGSPVDRLLRLSRESTSRKRKRGAEPIARTTRERGWTREELYERGSPGDDKKQT